MGPLSHRHTHHHHANLKHLQYEDDQQKSYIDLDYFISDAPGVYIIITSRSSTAKDIITLDAVEVAEIESLEVRELF